jgi:regulator of sigma E protease
MSALLVVIGIAGMFLLLIAPHEGGHFLFAKLFKVRVIEFSIGAGTRLWSTTRNGTVYAIRAFPILGYVRMGGMEAGDFDDPNGFHRKAAWQRILILVGGPLANFLVAILAYTTIGLTQVNDNPGKVVTVAGDTPAAAAGFHSGDTLKSVNGVSITDPGQLRKAEDAAPGAALVISGVGADGKPFSRVVVPARVCDRDTSRCQYQIGIQVAPLLAPGQALAAGVSFPYTAVKGIVLGLAQLVSGDVPGGVFGPNGFTGPIGIADVAAQSVTLGPETYFFFVALLSVALGFTNLLPFLALDGGRVVVVLIEALRRRPFDRTAELNFQRFGLVALLGLAAVISFLDIQRIATGQFPGLR